ncbi:MAG TPA: 5-(carboxyamino)imidazole ribonucleotide synthase [Bacillus sp. (in: firmicutes)]|nr:5-(carboxyamino)imidazole ribonucleotide synthase [Bacillus sp. (in: firmicutes)]
MTIYKDKFSITKPIKLGIVGGGQLGKMLAIEAKRMFMHVIILDPSPDCPASYIADKVIVGDFSNEQKIFELAEESDLITYEIELANSKALIELQNKGYIVHPSPDTLKIIQNKYRQKSFLKENGIPTPTFELITSKDNLEKICLEYGFPVMLKACENSYDGRGNYLIKEKDQITTAFSYFSGKQCMVEKFIDYKKEISIMIARNPSGDISYFPIGENVHKDNILHFTIAPAKIDKEIETQAIEIAVKTIKSLKGAGIFGIEMFIDKNNEGFINEIAPRPHNSGHYTIEACSISQFEQHIRAILNFPLPKPFLISNAIMINILGPKEIKGNYEINGVCKLFSMEGIKLHIYGKKVTNYHRKLGHVTVLLKNRDPIKIFEEIDKTISIIAKNQSDK